MAWIKRNLFFVIGGVLAIGLLGAAGYYNYEGWNHNTSAAARLKEIYDKLAELGLQKPGPGNDKVNNIQAAKDQEKEVRAWINRARDYFQPITPIPNSKGNVSSEAFASALRRTIDLLQREAETASVTLPPQYSFSFTEQRSLVKFTGALEPLAKQLGEIKTIAEIFFAAHVNSLDGIQRLRVSEDDASGPAGDYFDGTAVTNNLAVLTPYQVTFRSFSPEIGEVLAGFASSTNGFIVKTISVEPAGAATAGSTEAAGAPPPPPTAPLLPVPGRGGLRTILDEQLLRVTLVVDIVNLQKK